jgi:hypothetical protein
MIFYSCKNKDKEETAEAGFFPALSYIKGQVAHVDSSVFSIIKIIKRGDVSDTIYLKREEFKVAAYDFLSLPDITSGKLRKRYEETKLYDESLQKVSFTYLPKEKDQEIQQQVVIVKPDAQNNGRIETIFIDWLLNKEDSTVQKKLTWQANKYFRVITIVQKEGSPEKIETVEVKWDDPSAE